jgi:hypothetical protein
MAFHEQNTAVYITIYDAKLTRRFDAPNQKTVSRINKSGKMVHEQYFSAIEGMLLDIELRHSDYGRQWLFHFQDGIEKFVLQLDYHSREAKSFLSRLPNTKLDYFIRTQVFKNEKGVTQLFTRHGKTTIPSAYTKDNPNGLPEMVKAMQSDGSTKWDDTAQMVFFEQLAQDTNVAIYRVHGTPQRLRKSTPTADSAEVAFPAPTAELAAEFLSDVPESEKLPF